MGDLGQIYKVYYKILFDENINEESYVFDVKGLRIRNRNRDSYSFYNEENETVKIKKDILFGIFVEHNLDAEQPYVEAYFYTDDQDMFDVINEENRTDEEEKGIVKMKEDLKALVYKQLGNLIEKVKDVMDKVSE